MNALVPVTTAPPMTVSDVERVALAIAKGGLFGSKDPNAVLTLCLLAQAEGQHPAVVFRDYHVINGKPAKKAEAMLRDFINAGGKVEWHQLDDTCADATFTHPAGNARIAWDHKRAQTAGLGSNQMYRKFPRQMLRSRVISEGIRTVYPGATSGLYEEGEVASFSDPTPRPDPTPTDTGEVVEGEISTGEIEHVRVPGITKIKANLNKFMREGNRCTDLEVFRAMVKANKDDIKAIREAGHSYWTGDGEDWEGFGAWMERRYAALTPKEHSLEFNLLVSNLNECESWNELQGFLAKHGDAVETLDGEESREFERLYDERFEALKMVATASV
jgi:hypothetical protein